MAREPSERTDLARVSIGCGPNSGWHPLLPALLVLPPPRISWYTLPVKTGLSFLLFLIVSCSCRWPGAESVDLRVLHYSGHRATPESFGERYRHRHPLFTHDSATPLSSAQDYLPLRSSLFWPIRILHLLPSPKIVSAETSPTTS